MLAETVRKWEKQIRREERKEGQVEGMRKLLLQQMTHRFGRVPARVRQQVGEISSVQELRKLARRILAAESLRDLGLG